jgi:hypothetical protein
MKKLEKIIKEAILEVIAEGNKLYTLKNQTDSAKGLPSTLDPDDATEKSPAFTAKYKSVSEGESDEEDILGDMISDMLKYKSEDEVFQFLRQTLASAVDDKNSNEINEMSRIAVLYKIGDEDKVKEYLSTQSDTNKLNQQKIINLVKEKGQISPANIALSLGKTFIDKKGNVLPRQQSVNPDIKQLVDSGILEPVGGTGIAASRIDKKTGKVAPPTTKQTLEPEDFFIGKGKFDGPAFEPSDEEVAASFARARAAGDGGEEEFVANLKKDAPKVKPTISDEEYNKLMKFLDYKERLRKIESALRQNKKISRGGDDMISKDRGEAEKLSNMKTDLENRIEDLVAGSEYLQRRKAPEDKNKNR